MPGLSGEIANLIVSLKLDDSGFSGKLNNVARGLSRMDAGLSQMGRGVGQVGAGLSRMATVAAAAAAGGLAAIVTTAVTMEEAFTGVQKTVDETANVSFEDLRKTLREMSSDTGTAFEELSRIGEIGGALGVGIESLDDFIDVVNRLSVSTDLTVDTASTALGQLGTILHLTGDDYRSFADTLVALGNAGASTEPQIVDLAARFAAAGNRAGLSSNEILALSSAVTSMGVEVEAGGTALSQTFNNIALAIGTGSKEVEGFTEVLGISAAEFRKRWETDALGTFQEFLREVDKLSPIAQATALDMAGITGSRQINAIGLMADNYGFLAEQLVVAEGATGALNEESDKFFATSAASFRRLRENVRLSANAIGAELLPVVNDLVKEFVDFVSTDEAQRGLQQFGKDLAAGIRGLVSELKGTDFSGLIGGMKLAAEVASGAFALFRGLPQPIQQLAIAALVANKVTGGAVGQIAKGLANIAFGALKVMTVQAGVVNINAGVVNGGPGGLVGGPAAAGGAGAVIRSFLGVGTAVALGAIIGDAIGRPIYDETIKPALEYESEQVAKVVARANPEELRHAIAELDKNIAGFEQGRDEPIIGPLVGLLEGFLVGDEIQLLKDQKATLEAMLLELRKPGGTVRKITGGQKGKVALPDTAFDPGGGVVQLPNTAMSALRDTAQATSKLPSIQNRQESAVRTLAAQVSAQRAATERGFANQSGYLNRQSGYLSTIAAKNFSPRISVKVNSSVSITDITRRLVSARVATGTISEF